MNFWGVSNSAEDFVLAFIIMGVRKMRENEK